MSKVTLRSTLLQAAIDAAQANRVTAEALGTGDGSATVFNDTTVNKPVVPGTVTILVDSTAVAIDDKQGNIVALNSAGSDEGADVSGTINYNTGAISLTFGEAVGNGLNITCNYTHDFGIVPGSFKPIADNKESFGGGINTIQFVAGGSGGLLQVKIEVQQHAG